MAIRLIFFLLLTLFFIGANLKISAQDTEPLKDYTIEVWSAVEGLPSNNLRHIAKDQNGFLWISTFNGLVRFDGNEFKNFTTDNVPILSTSVFYSVLALDGGKMFISTQSSGVVCYENGKFSKIADSENLPNSIQTTFLDPNGRLWIGARNRGVYYLEDDKISHFSIKGFDDKSVKGFAIDSLENIWIASEGAGVAKVDGDKVEIFSTSEGLSSNIVNSVVFHKGNVYAGTEKGLSIYENGNWVKDESFGKGIINYLGIDVNSNMWIASDIGLARINYLNKLEFITEENGLPSRQVSSIAFDDENNIWLSTKRGGLVQLKLSNFKNITPIDGLSYQGVNVVAEAPNGRYLIGSDNGDIDIMKDGVISKLTLQKDLTDVSIKDIYTSEDGTLWLATYDGVIKKKGDVEEYFTAEDGLLSNKTRRIYEGADGVIWIGSRSGGLNKIYKDGRIESIAVKDGLGSNFVFSVDGTPDGRILAGTANGGLNIIYKDGHIEILKPDSTLTGFSIFNIYIENDNRFWLATNVGLYCYQDKKFTLIGPQNGLGVETLFDIQEDKNGYLWASSILGIVRVKKEEVLEFIEGKIDRVNSSILDGSDGMVSRECTGATRTLKSTDGRIWIPTIKGVSILDPQNLVVNTKVPSVFIEDIIVDDIKVEPKVCCNNEGEEVVVIEPGHRNYTINYTSLSMYSPKKVLFKYKLEGFDKEWIEIGSERQAKYTNLPYGKYTFKVLAANNNGVWSGDYAYVNIEVEPFFYKTKWFIITLILIFIVFTYLIYTFQTKEVNKRNSELVKLNKELDSFSYSVSHDLKAPLSSIQGLLNIARLEEGKGALDYYDRIESSVDKLNSFIKDIMDYSKNARMGLEKEEFYIKELILNMVEGISDDDEAKKIDFSLDVLDELELISDKTRFTFIVNNLLSNAFRYADLTKENPFVKVAAKIEENRFYLTIEDNGQGIKKEYQNKVFDMFYRANEFKSGSGLGLYIVKESLDKLNGTVRLQSELKVGTVIYIEIPC